MWLYFFVVYFCGIWAFSSSRKHLLITLLKQTIQLFDFFSGTWPQGWILEIWNLISRSHGKVFQVQCRKRAKSFGMSCNLLKCQNQTRKCGWKKSAEFYKFTNFPTCVGSVDAKHIRMQHLPNSGSDYFNFKKYFSIILMAVADANYYFTSTDVGSYGHEGDTYV